MKLLILSLCLLALSACTSMPDPYKNDGNIFEGRERFNWSHTDEEKKQLYWMLGCQSADLATTAYGLNNGFTEVNPLFGDTIEGVALGKAIITAATITAGAMDRKNRKKYYKFASIFGCGAAAWNGYQLSK